MKKILVLIIILLIGSCIYFNRDNLFNKKEISNIVTNSDTNIIDDILAYNKSDIDKDFLEYIKDTYKTKTLKKVLNTLKNDTYNITIWHELTGYSYTVLKDMQSNLYSSMDNIQVVDDESNTMSFVGDISLAENYKIMPKYDERNIGVNGILSDEVLNIMRSSSVMIANNEFTISERGQALSGKMYTFRANPSRLKIYDEMGVDLVTLANNHVYDFGADAFADSLKYLNEYNIPYIGAGSNKTEAEKPYYFVINGYKIAFINATRAEKNIMTPEATETSGGVFRCYDETELKNVIAQTKTISDYVVVLIHWGAEGSHELEQVQLDSSKDYIDSGADIIVGTHAHALQGIEFYNGKFIAYNLGDFIFNSYTEDTGILSITVNDDGSFEYKFNPCIQENEYTSLLTDDSKKSLLSDMESWSINASFNEDGVITLKS